MTTTQQEAFVGFTADDFDVFTIPGLEPRMTALIEQIRPKLHVLGSQYAPLLSVLCGEVMHPHVAKHARRTINPPNDTWVAFANNKRGYKAHPHFQIGLWKSHLFVQFALIYEANTKAVFADQALKRLKDLRKQVPAHYVWSGDHSLPGGTPHLQMHNEDLETLFHRLKTVKAAELVCGLNIERDDPLLSDGAKLAATIEDTFKTLMPLYRMAF
ncbi:DUF1054 domain-containing protein [Paenibacillaceae bacterium]|nr:DUF1054 domain-containing protein [Paenibacillaceae bacterium]